MDTLFSRFRNQGTLAEPDGIPDPTFALPSTVNWMKDLSLVSTEENVCFGTAKAFFAHQHQNR